MVESMSHGVACLCMRGDGARYHTANHEILENGVDGFLADSDEAFCHELERLICTPALLRAAGEQARQTVAERYTWDALPLRATKID